MNKLEQAARQALAEQAAEPSGRCKWCLAYNGHLDFCPALSEQAEQEPVAEVVLRKQTVGFGRTEERKDIQFLADVGVGSKLYAKPQQQAEQEPVAWVDEHGLFSTINPNNNDWLPLYAAPVRTKDLTDDEILMCVKSQSIIETVRRAIAADREKNK